MHPLATTPLVILLVLILEPLVTEMAHRNTVSAYLEEFAPAAPMHSPSASKWVPISPTRIFSQVWNMDLDWLISIVPLPSILFPELRGQRLELKYDAKIGSRYPLAQLHYYYQILLSTALDFMKGSK